MTMALPPDRLAQVQAVIAGLFSPKIAVAVTDPRMPQPVPFGDEAAHLSKAVHKRQQEFAAGRAMARRAMSDLGVAPVVIPAGGDRAPHWPRGVWGSISHTATLCAAVISVEPVLLGLDIEGASDLSPGLLPTVCSDAELSRIAGPDQGYLAKVIFSAKEAAYKAQYPETGMVFGFDHFDVSLDLTSQSFVATFTMPTGSFTPGDVLQGRFAATQDHVVTAVKARHPLRKGA